MQKKLLLTIAVIIIGLNAYSQQLPPDVCGVVNVYDANGNRKKRQYHCNIQGWGIYPTKIKQDKNNVNNTETKETVAFQPIDALYPNPTSGKFYVTFSSELKNAKVMLLDINGKIIQQSVGNGFKLSFDLSNVASGVYLMRIETEQGVVSKKVIKQ